MNSNRRNFLKTSVFGASFIASGLSACQISEVDPPALRHIGRQGHDAPTSLQGNRQPSAGGRILDYGFWRRFAEIENVVAIKIAPFNRYQTLDVVRAVSESGRAEEIALYTGNDDNILLDLWSSFDLGCKHVRIAGGLLGHWAVWTRRAVELLNRAKAEPITPELVTLSHQVTDSNAALFDPANQFQGCIAGLHEVLCRQGLMAGTWCLDPNEGLSPGQAEEIDRVCRSYPWLTDDNFVAENLAGWLQ